MKIGPPYLAACEQHGGKASTTTIGAVAHSILVAVYYVLLRETEYIDLGPDYFSRHENTKAHVHRLVRQLENLGMPVTVENIPGSA